MTGFVLIVAMLAISTEVQSALVIFTRLRPTEPPAPAPNPKKIQSSQKTRSIVPIGARNRYALLWAGYIDFLKSVDAMDNAGKSLQDWLLKRVEQSTN